VGVTGKATSNVVNIPCPEPVRPADESLTKGLSPKEDTPNLTTVPVTFDLTGNLFIGQVKQGQALWTGGVSGVVHSGDFEAPIEFDPANVNIEVKVSEEIGKAVAYYERGWWKKHTALVATRSFGSERLLRLPLPLHLRGQRGWLAIEHMPAR
jgi:hypothetical protein